MAEIKKADLKSMDIPEDKLRQLKDIFPEAFAEGLKVDFEKLKIVIGKDAELGKERFGMNWPGKADCFKNIQAPSVATLIPAKEESVNFDSTENLFIEGDNLEVLKLLQKSYYGKIKMIYIDPPYNTGNDFIYPDSYAESLDTYLRYSGQIDNVGRKYSTNAETDGRFHSKWLNMMYPRLYTARNLLREDGVVFISIDDNEASNLRKICDEIFGEENFLGSIARKTKLTSNKGTHFAPSHEYILVYSKNIIETPMFNDEEALEDEDYLKLFRFDDKKGKYNEVSLYMPSLDPMRGCTNQRYFISCPDGSLVLPPGEAMPKEKQSGSGVKPTSSRDKVWRWTFDTFSKKLSEDRVVFKQTKTSPLIDPEGNQAKWNIYTKIYLHERQETGMLPNTFFDKYPNSSASKLLLKLNIPFPFSKPYELIMWLQKISGVQENDVVLDFFAGSCTTAHAVLVLNKQGGGNRKFICVQLPELCAEDSEALSAGYKTIADIGKERIRRAIKMIQEEQKGQLDFKQRTLDMGFKVFKLAKSNFKVWEGDIDPQKETVEKQLEMHVDHINPKSSQDDILFELLLKAGFELTTKIEKISMAGKSVYSIEGGLMLICLEKELTKEVIKAMAEKNPSRVICLDQGFAGNDQLKTNAVQIMKSKGVEDFRTI